VVERPINPFPPYYKVGWKKVAGYKSIKVREDVYRVIRELAEKYKTTVSSVVLRAVSFLVEAEKKPRVKERLPLADKISWYVTKVLMSAGAFKSSPTDENYQRLVKNLEDLRERLGVDVSLQLDIIRRLKDKASWTADEKMDYNAAFKMLVLQLLWILEEREAA
jgi:hypothetical protein